VATLGLADATVGQRDDVNMPGAKASLRAEQAELRDRMRALGLGYEQIAAEFARRYRLRPRAAWRHAYGWSLNQAADQINATAAKIGLDRDGRAAMSGPHLSEYEQWPGHGPQPTGRKPTPHVLALLAATYGTSAFHDLLDMADFEHLSPTDLLILDKRRDPWQAAATKASAGPRVRETTEKPGVPPVPQRRAPGSAQDPVRLLTDAGLVPMASTPLGAGGGTLAAVTGVTALGLSGQDGWPEGDVVTTVAHESSEHAGVTASHNLDGATLDQFQDDIARITRNYTTVSPVAAFMDARRLRDLGYHLLGHTRRPGQEADLYFAVGVACGLLAAASFDLGCWDATTEQARAAWVYGTQIGHAGLRSWAKGMQALVAYWSGDPAAALTLAGEAQDAAPAGTAMVRLRCIEARAWAHQGRAPEAERAIASAEAARERADGSDELHDRIGGQFGFDSARQARCHATAYLQLGKPGEAITRAETAIGLYAAMPPGQRWVKIEAQAHADLASAHLMGGDLDGARDAFLPVLRTAPDLRVEGLTRRVQRIADLLANRQYRGSKLACQLGSEIDEFTAGTLRRAIES
jgi:hypothetical protein